MNIIGLLLKQIIIMFVLMGIGFILFKVGFISETGSKDMSKILLYLVVPVVIIKNFMIERTSENIEIFLHATLLTLIACAIAMIIAHIFFSKGDGIANFCSAFANTGFIGLPIVEAIYGEIGVFCISMMIVMISALEWTYGVYILSKDKSVIKPKKILTNPIIIAVAVGLIIFLCQIPVPSIISTIFESISGLNTPLAMMISGVYLAQSDLLRMLKKLEVYKVTFVRLILIPFVILIIFKSLPFDAIDVKMVILIGSACPVGGNVAIFANVYNKDYISAVEQVCTTTLLCLITLPLIVSLATLLIR